MGSVEDGFGRRARREREARGWSQQKIADELAARGIDVHPSAIAKIEDRDVSRARAIRLDEAAALAEIFDLSLDDMTAGDPAVGALFDAAYWLNRLQHAADEGLRATEWLDDAEKRPGPTTSSEAVEAVRAIRAVVDDTVARLEDASKEGSRGMRHARKLRSRGA